MVLSGDACKYEELRTAYNSVIDQDDACCLRAPPMEEWRGMTSVCEQMFCRWVVLLSVLCVTLRSMRPFSRVVECETCRAVDLDWCTLS